MNIKHPEIKVKNFGQDGNAFALMGQVTQAMKRGGLPRDEIEAFRKEAMSGDYDHLLQTCGNWVTI